MISLPFVYLLHVISIWWTSLFYMLSVCSILYKHYYMCFRSLFSWLWNCRDLLPKSRTTQSLERHSTAPGKFLKSQRTFLLTTVTLRVRRMMSAPSSSRGAQTGKPSCSTVQSRCLTTPLVSPKSTVCLGFFSVSQNLRKYGKYVTFFICVSYFWAI